MERWRENVVWQYFSGQDYYTPRLPCDATQIGCFRTANGETGVEELLKDSIDAAVKMEAVEHGAFVRVSPPGRCSTRSAQPSGTKQAATYANAWQFERMRRVVKRQRTILGILLRECAHKLDALQPSPAMIKAIRHLQTKM